MPKFEKKPEKVEAWRTNRERKVQTPDGFRTAQPGQWIAVVGNGLYVVMDDAAFRAAYKPRDKTAEKALDAPLKTMEEVAKEQQEKADADAAKTAKERKAEAEEAAKAKAKQEKEDKKKADAEAKAKAKEEEKAKKSPGVLKKIKDKVTGKGGEGDPPADPPADGEGGDGKDE